GLQPAADLEERLTCTLPQPAGRISQRGEQPVLGCFPGLCSQLPHARAVEDRTFRVFESPYGRRIVLQARSEAGQIVVERATRGVPRVGGDGIGELQRLLVDGVVD